MIGLLRWHTLFSLLGILFLAFGYYIRSSTVLREWFRFGGMLGTPGIIFTVPHSFFDSGSVMNPLFLNNTCTPYESVNPSSCTLGNLAEYSINVTSAADAIAGVKFARTHRIRLVVKNTGHDYLGRSTGQGALSLWTHNLQDSALIENHTSSTWNGAALRLGAAGYCPTGGTVGDYYLNSGFGALAAAYGLGSDNFVLSYAQDDQFYHLITFVQIQHMQWNLVPGLTVPWQIQQATFSIDFVSWPGHTSQELAPHFRPLLDYLDTNGFVYNWTLSDDPGYSAHFARWQSNLPYGPFTINAQIGSRFITREAIENHATDLTSLIRTNLAADSRFIFGAVGFNCCSQEASPATTQ
ncbi:hypothetical protein B0I35DRAFT_415412 [Stachybotrys elegans]|uniref:FAD linked oxidase N-terminal domain-containing protein n=1 Tax=Stachybotrys elegans TaxID=80388 RepID=A0A8K0SD38_9HYPO|nr:hypothetical protein B0I35DRAFT_415412 [Stachybotrys elegans]